MEPIQQSEQEAEKLKTELNIEPAGALTPPGALTTVPPKPSTDQPWEEWVQPVTDFLSKLPDYVGGFFNNYQKPLTTVGLIVSGLVAVKVTLAVLDAINDIPLLAPMFELVGISYTTWFVYRYLLKVENRQELSEEFKSLKGQVVGKD